MHRRLWNPDRRKMLRSYSIRKRGYQHLCFDAVCFLLDHHPMDGGFRISQPRRPDYIRPYCLCNVCICCVQWFRCFLRPFSPCPMTGARWSIIRFVLDDEHVTDGQFLPSSRGIRSETQGYGSVPHRTGLQDELMKTIASCHRRFSVGLMPHDRHIVMRMQELLDNSRRDADFDGNDALGEILRVKIKAGWLLLTSFVIDAPKTTVSHRTLSEDQKKAIYCLCAVSDKAHASVVQLFDFADIPIEEEKAIVVAGLSDIPTGVVNWPSRMVAYGILMTMTSKERLWPLMAKVVGGNIHSTSWVAMPSPIAHPEFELDRMKDRITIGGRMYLISMLVSLTVLSLITPGRQVISSNKVMQEWLGVTSYNAGLFIESFEHAFVLYYIMIFAIAIITPITLFIFLVREVGLVKVSVEDSHRLFRSIMNRKMITKLTTLDKVAIVTGLSTYYTVTADPSLFGLLKDLTGLLQIVTISMRFPIAYACYANSPMIPHVIRAFDESLYQGSRPAAGRWRNISSVDERTMSVSMKVIDDEDTIPSSSGPGSSSFAANHNACYRTPH